ncbi:PIN domain-containing protein [Candidatus Woesearchaeota archaeon]|nr:PIN domain-containing protein [Candidatus Woesearchaeota archaeon]
MKLLDTTFLIDILRGKEETKKILESNEQMLTTQINMYEVIKGLFLKNITSSKFASVMKIFENIRVLSFDNDAVIKSAEIYSNFTKKGLEIHNFDCMIAGIALANNINKIVTRNKEHFKRIKEIKVENY